MATSKIYLDVREEEELLEKRLVPLIETIKAINIPVRNVFANVDWIKKFKRPVVIICRSSARSQFVKDFYFKEDENIIVFNGRFEDVEKEGDVKVVKGKGGFGLQQYRNIMFMLILTILLILYVLKINKNVFIGIVVLILFTILYQTIHKVCFLSKIIPMNKI